jgi:hypothetical protein
MTTIYVINSIVNTGPIISCGMSDIGSQKLCSFVHQSTVDNNWYTEDNCDFKRILSLEMHTAKSIEDQYFIFRKIIVWGKFVSLIHYKITCDMFVDFINARPEIILFDAKLSHPLCCETTSQSDSYYLKNTQHVELVEKNFAYFIETMKKCPSFSIGDFIKKDYNTSFDDTENEKDDNEFNKMLNKCAQISDEEIVYWILRNNILSIKTISLKNYKSLCYDFLTLIKFNKNIVIYDNSLENTLSKELKKIVDLCPHDDYVKEKYNCFCGFMATQMKISLINAIDEYGTDWNYYLEQRK